MSTYADFIDDILKSEYEFSGELKDDEQNTIISYSHKSTGKKIVKIASKTRNDHIYRKLRGVEHENLPAIYDVCSCDDCVVVLESFVDGETLDVYSAENGIDETFTFEIIFDICNALDYLHSNNIIHRDVKPSNIIITPEKRAVLIDFSAAKIMVGGQDKDTYNLGTVGYAAPEQYGVYHSTPSTDIYALGVMFNELLCNAHPSFKTPSGRLGKIIRKCTDTQISKRYQNIKSLVKDLNRYRTFRI